MAETNECKLQALWWKRVLSAFTKRQDRQEIPYVLELLRCVGDQRATETAHRAWLLTRRDRADARRCAVAAEHLAQRRRPLARGGARPRGGDRRDHQHADDDPRGAAGRADRRRQWQEGQC